MLVTKTHINNEFIGAIKLLCSADELVTCEAKNVYDKADLNVGKGNIAIWYHCVVCSGERAMVSMGFTRNSYGWVPADTQLAVCDLARGSQFMRYLWPDSYGFCWKIHLPEVENHVLWGRVGSVMWDKTFCYVLKFWTNVILGLLWNGHLTKGDEWKVTEAYVFENICMLSLYDLPVDKRLLNRVVTVQAVSRRNDQCSVYDI